MNILSLGATGYLGKKLINALCDGGHTLVCTRRKPSSKLQVVGVNKEIEWIPANVDAVSIVCDSIQFDCVINLVCNYGKGSTAELLEANLEFPLEILNKIVEKGVKKFITIGTGLPDDFNMYSFTKKKFSDFGKFYAEQCGITFLNFKLEMFYGADEPEDRFLPSVIKKMLLGESVDMTLGTQRRDIIAVEDVVRAILLVLESDKRGYHDISVGTGCAPTIANVIDYIWDETGRKSIVNKGVIPMRKNEPDCVADNSFLEGLGEWKPMHWKCGIKKMIETMGVRMIEIESKRIK